MSNHNEHQGRKQLGVIIAVVSVIIAALLTVLGLAAVFQNDEDTTRLMLVLGVVTTMLSAPTLSLLALLKANDVQNDLHNGVMQPAVREAVKQAIEDNDGL